MVTHTHNTRTRHARATFLPHGTRTRHARANISATRHTYAARTRTISATTHTHARTHAFCPPAVPIPVTRRGFPGAPRMHTARTRTISPSHPCSSNGGVSDLGFHPNPDTRARVVHFRRSCLCVPIPYIVLRHRIAFAHTFMWSHRSYLDAVTRDPDTTSVRPGVAFPG